MDENTRPEAAPISEDAATPSTTPDPALDGGTRVQPVPPAAATDPFEALRVPVSDGTLARRTFTHVAFKAAVFLSATTMIGAVSFAAGSIVGQHATNAPSKVAIAAHKGTSTSFAQGVHDAAKDAVVSVSVPGESSGTGFFYTENRIVTNAHVITGSVSALRAAGSGTTLEVDVRLADGRDRVAEVLAYDTRLDLAILEVEPGLGVPALAFTETENARVGQDVAVIGYPFGGGQMISTGVLSGIAQNSRFSETDVQNLMLQTDAPVNPGNSGGPLLDATGSVLGIVTLRPDNVDGRAVEGTALAIPANQALNAIRQLEQDGKVAYPVVGVTLRDVNPDDEVPAGAVVEEVTAKSPSVQAGVEVGDIVVAVDGTEVASGAEVILHLASKKPGDKMRLELLRGGESIIKTVTLGSR